MSEAPSQLPFALRAIYFRESTMKLSAEFNPLVPGQPLAGRFRTMSGAALLGETVESTEPQVRTMTFLTVFEFRYNANKSGALDPSSIADEALDDENVLAEISATIAADYLVISPELPTEEYIQNWAKSSALVHSWPYWREFCHSAMMRLNLPVSIVPMLELKATAEAIESQKQLTSKPGPRKPRVSRSKVPK